jgi:hypothetical protein
LLRRIERIFYATLRILTLEQFFYTIFIDESTFKATKNGAKIWYMPFHDETRNGLIGRYAHGLSVHVIAGISRRVATRIAIFKERSCDSVNFQELLRFFNNFFFRKYPEYRSHATVDRSWSIKNTVVNVQSSTCKLIRGFTVVYVNRICIKIV